MSHELISRSPDIQQLRDEGYEIEVRSGILVVTHVPFVAPNRQVLFGVLISKLDLAGEVAENTAQDHVTSLVRGVPCHSDGSRMTQIIVRGRSGGPWRPVSPASSASPASREGYRDYFDKMTTYIRIISGA